jgi:hypothetical protein
MHWMSVKLPDNIQMREHSWPCLISLRFGFGRNFLSVLHPNLVSSPIKGILEILNLTPRCIPMDILAWTDCVRSSAGVHEFSKMAVSLNWILDYFVEYTL